LQQGFVAQILCEIFGSSQNRLFPPFLFFLYWFIWQFRKLPLGAARKKTKKIISLRGTKYYQIMVSVKKGRRKRIIPTPRVSGEYTPLWCRR
jgi:hypothetical protein